MRRRSPVRHTVSKHTRMGKTVQSYKRGSGRAIRRRRVVRRTYRKNGLAWKEHRLYTTVFEYDDKKVEVVQVVADNPEDATNYSYDARKRQDKIPVNVAMSNSIASVVSAIASGIVQVAGGAVVGVGRGVRETVTVAQAHALKARASKVQQLYRMTKSRNPVEASMAREQLVEKYPEEYEFMKQYEKGYVPGEKIPEVETREAKTDRHVLERLSRS